MRELGRRGSVTVSVKGIIAIPREPRGVTGTQALFRPSLFSPLPSPLQVTAHIRPSCSARNSKVQAVGPTSCAAGVCPGCGLRVPEMQTKCTNFKSEIQGDPPLCDSFPFAMVVQTIYSSKAFTHATQMESVGAKPSHDQRRRPSPPLIW